jgi:hypothetical protein
MSYTSSIKMIGGPIVHKIRMGCNGMDPLDHSINHLVDWEG